MATPRVAAPATGPAYRPCSVRPVATHARRCVAARRVVTVHASTPPPSYREDERGGGGNSIDMAPTPTPTSLPLFSYTKQWWPVTVESDTPTDRPVPVKLLGKRLVLWRDSRAGVWRCVASACPHRLAPLETGRLEDGGAALVCSYHGWAIGGDGTTLRVPQADHDSPACGARACASRRSRVGARPTATAASLVWVWGDGSETAVQDAAAAPPPAVSDVIGDRAPDVMTDGFPLTTNQQFARFFPVPFAVMTENLCDQSHVPYAHSGVAYNADAPWRSHFEVSDVTVATDGDDTHAPQLAATGARGAGDGLSFTLEWSPDSINPPIKQRVRFVPPCLVEYATPDDAGGFRTTLWFYVTPVDTHTTLVFNHAVVTQPPAGVPPFLMSPLLSLLAARPRWMDHLLLNNVFDGDLAYLPQSAANARQAELEGKTWSRAYYLPASADNSVIAWRRWLHGRGKGGWEGDAGVPLGEPRHDVPPSALYNRLDDHTAHCSSCKGAMTRARGLAAVLRAGGVTAVAAAAGSAACDGSTTNIVAWLAAAGGAAAAAAAADAFAQLFVFKEYEHWNAR